MSKKIPIFQTASIVFSVLFLFLAGGAGIAKAQTPLPVGGSSFETAANLQPGTYQGTRLLERQAVFYSIQANAGQKISIEAGNFSESGCTIYLYNGDQEELTYDYSENPKINWLAGKSSNYYLKIENDASEVASFSLKISSTNYYDANSQTDAGDSFDGAMNIVLGNHSGYLAGNANITSLSGDDDKDFYKIELKKGTTYNFKLIPPSKTELTLSLYDSNRQLLKEENSENKGAAISAFLSPSSDTTIFVSVFNNLYAYQDDLVNYHLEIATSASAAAFYSCEDGYCQIVGEFVSLEECQKTTTKTCYPSSACGGKCEGTGIIGEPKFPESDIIPNKPELPDSLPGSGGFLKWGLFAGLYFLLLILVYVYFAICLQVIAKKTNTPNGWFAWIPILNLILMIQIAQKPIWWIIMFFIPLVNIVFGVIVWMAIAERRGKPNWVGILILVPVIDIAVPGYLAFSGDKAEVVSSYAPTGTKEANKPTVGYKHSCKYCGKLIPPNSAACPFCEKMNPLGPDRCPKCHEPTDKKWKVCAKCNQNLRIVCPFCGKVTFFGDYCEDCGARLLVVCPKCGQEQPPIGDNCIKCGEPLKPKQA